MSWIYQLKRRINEDISSKEALQNKNQKERVLYSSRQKLFINSIYNFKCEYYR